MSFHYILNPPRTLKEMGMKIFVKTVLFQASFDHFLDCAKNMFSQ